MSGCALPQGDGQEAGRHFPCATRPAYPCLRSAVSSASSSRCSSTITIPHTFMRNTAGDLALIDIRSLAVFSGRLPPRVTGLVIEWATLHQLELLADWDRARAREELQKIAPLE